MKEKVLKIISQLVWFKQLLLVFRYCSLHDISQFFVVEFVPSLYFPKQAIPSEKVFHINPDVYSIWWILIFCDQAIVNHVMTC